MSIAKASAARRQITVSPIIAGIVLSALAIMLASIEAYHLWQVAQSDTEQAIVLEQRQIAAEQATRQLSLVKTRARAIVSQMDPLCSGAPPAVQAFLLVTNGAPGLQLRVTSSDGSVKPPPNGLAAGLVIDATGSESAVVRWLASVDNNRDLRNSIALQTITRPNNSQDLRAPAQAASVDGSFEIRSYSIDSSLCAQVHHVIKV